MDVLSTFRLIYIVGAANALFFSLLVFTKKSKSLADRILGWWLVILFFQLAIPALYLANLMKNYHYAGIEITLYIFHPLFLYYYVKAMTGKIGKLKKLLWNIPAIIIYEAMCLVFFAYPAKERLQFIEGKDYLSYQYMVPFSAIMGVYFVWNIYASYKILRDYKENVLQVYSYRENVDLMWLRRLIIIFAIISFLVFPLGLISYYGFHTMAFTDYFFFITLVVFVFFLGFWGYQQGEVFKVNNHHHDETSVQDSEMQQEHNEPVVDKRYKKEAAKLDGIMKKEKLYLNPTLTIHDLADHMAMPAHQLSKVINREFHCNFFEYINAYRIEDFKLRAFTPDYKNLTILAVALDCGFNSKSAFNRIFKDVTGLTPGEYIRHHKE